MSVAANLARVRASLADNAAEDATHGHILEAYSDAIREHEARLAGHRDALERTSKRRRKHGAERGEEKRREARFRFKNKDKAKEGDGREARRKHRDTGRNDKRRPEKNPYEEAEEAERVQTYSAHPLPRPEHQQWLDPSLDETHGTPLSGPSEHDANDTSHGGGKGYGKRSTRNQSGDPNIPRSPSEDTVRDPDEAFKASLFDALADDEGAAAYWEGVYSQPLNVYPRPKLRKDGNVAETAGDDPYQEMTDEEYVQFVKQKMWEKANPHLVKEIRLREERAREERERKERRRKGETSPNSRDRSGGPMDDVEAALARGEERRSRRMRDLRERERWEGVWEGYVRAWKAVEALTERHGKDIPWPVEGRTISKANSDSVRHFLDKVIRYVLPRMEGTEDVDGKLKVALLKAERFRWHPDKIQHRFGGREALGEEVMEVVTGVFQVIDEMLDYERKRQ